MCKENQYTNDSESPVFIVGCMRSGTTLLRQMLNSHPHLAIFHESYIFRSWYLLRKYFKVNSTTNDRNMRKFIAYFLDTYNPYANGSKPIFKFLNSPDLRNALMDCDRSPRTILKILMESWAQSQKKPRWGDKVTLIHRFEIQTMYRMFPQAKFIHMVRDARGVSYSLVKADWSSDSLEAAYLWRYSILEIRKGLSRIPASQVFEIRYEDLCTMPRQKLEQLCVFLTHEAYFPEMLTSYQKKDEVISNMKIAEIVRNVDKALIRDNYLKWRDGLTKKEIRYCLDYII